MKARIEKKLSKKLVKLAPKLFRDAWIFDDASELAEKQNTRVSNVYHVGGELDYWGEGQDDFTAWQWFKIQYEWLGNFDQYPKGHNLYGYQNTEKFNPTTKNLLNLARKIG